MPFFDLPGKFDACFIIVLTFPLKIDIGNNAKDGVLIFFKILPGLFVIGTE